MQQAHGQDLSSLVFCADSVSQCANVQRKARGWQRNGDTESPPEAEGGDRRKTILTIRPCQGCASQGPDRAWRVALALGAAGLRRMDPVLLLTQMLQGRGLGTHSEVVCTIFTELFNNAVEHGLLKLDASVRDSPAGVRHYDVLRRERLQRLQDGYILIELWNTPHRGGGRLVLRITDSGLGFDHRAHHDGRRNQIGFGGRGIPVVRALAHELVFRGRGNIAEAIYLWA